MTTCVKIWPCLCIVSSPCCRSVSRRSSSGSWSRSSGWTGRSSTCRGGTSSRSAPSVPACCRRPRAGSRSWSSTGSRRLEGADTIIVPSWNGEPSAAVLEAVRRSGARLVSICSGVFLLAATGRLAGREVATHWRYAERLAAEHPELTVNADVLYVDGEDVLTSAGSAAGIDLCLHLDAPRPRVGGGERGRAAARDPAAPGRRAGAADRPADGGAPGRRPDRAGDGVGAGAPGSAAGPDGAGRAGVHERAHVHPPLPARDRQHARALADRAARARLTGAAGELRRARGDGGGARGVRERGHVPASLHRDHAHDADRVPARVLRGAA